MEEEIASGNIVRKGTFDLKDFFVTLHSILKNNLGYGGFSEDDYNHYKREGDFDAEWHWTFSRNATTKDTYTNFRIWIECKARFIKKVKIKVGNEMRSTDSGEIEFNIKGVLITDPDDMWVKNKFLRFLNSIGPSIRGEPFAKFLYEKYLYRPTYLGYLKRMWEHVFYVENEVKSFFDIPRF